MCYKLGHSLLALLNLLTGSSIDGGASSVVAFRRFAARLLAFGATAARALAFDSDSVIEHLFGGREGHGYSISWQLLREG
jgi:hypothetical protein